MADNREFGCVVRPGGVAKLAVRVKTIDVHCDAVDSGAGTPFPSVGSMVRGTSGVWNGASGNLRDFALLDG